MSTFSVFPLHLSLHLLHARYLQPRVATTCGKPSPSPVCRWKMVKQWLFHVLGHNSVLSSLAYDADGRKFRMDLVPLFKSLAELRTDRATTSSVNDFWADFMVRIDIPSIHEQSHRHVKLLLSEHWRKLTGEPFPPRNSDNKVDAMEVCKISDSGDFDVVMLDADLLPDRTCLVVCWCLLHAPLSFAVRTSFFMHTP